MKPLGKLSNIFDRTCDLLAILAAVLLMLTLVLVNSEVFIRGFTGHSIIWVIEICEYCLLFITFLGTAWLLKRNGHIMIDFVVLRLRSKPQAAVRIFSSIISLIVSLVMTWYSIRVTLGHFQAGYVISSGLMPRSFIILSVIPVGSFLLSIQFMRMTYEYLKGWQRLSKQEQTSVDETPK